MCFKQKVFALLLLPDPDENDQEIKSGGHLDLQGSIAVTYFTIITVGSIAVTYFTIITVGSIAVTYFIDAVGEQSGGNKSDRRS